MRRAHSPGSDASDTDADRQAEYEQEYMNLQRQYRLLEKDHRNYMQESSDRIKRQNADIERLERERSELETNSRLIQSESNARRDKRQRRELETLGQLKKDSEKELEEEKKKQQELDAEIRELEAKERQQSGKSDSRGGSSSGGRRGGGEKSGKGERKTEGGSNSNDKRKLENQLQLSNNKFGKLLESNRLLRADIDNLRVERQKFDELYQRLVREKEILKQKTNEIIEDSTQAYEQRVEAQEKMASLREKNDKDVQQHNTEMKELRRVIDHDHKLQGFMKTKGEERDEDPQLVAWRERKELFEKERKKASETDSVESYEIAMEDIKKITQKDDINLIVSQFVEGEAENFALLNLVNEQSNRVEQLQECIEKLYRDIDQLMKDGAELEKSREHILKNLEKHQVRCKADTEKYNEKCVELKKVLDEVKSGVSELFDKISCDRSSIDESLGSEEGVTDGNVIQHLAIIEERTNQLLLMQAFVVQQKDWNEFVRRQTTLLGDGPLPQNQFKTDPASIIGPDSDASDVEPDEGKLPLSREVIEERARRAIEKKESRLLANESKDKQSVSGDRTSKAVAKQEKHKSMKA